MQNAFPTIVWAVVAVAVLVAIYLLLRPGRGDTEIGDRAIGERDAPARAETAAEREEDIRQMLEASNAHRIRAGREPLDVDAEVKRRLREPT